MTLQGFNSADFDLRIVGEFLIILEKGNSDNHKSYIKKSQFQPQSLEEFHQDLVKTKNSTNNLFFSRPSIHGFKIQHLCDPNSTKVFTIFTNESFLRDEKFYHMPNIDSVDRVQAIFCREFVYTNFEEANSSTFNSNAKFMMRVQYDLPTSQHREDNQQSLQEQTFKVNYQCIESNFLVPGGFSLEKDLDSSVYMLRDNQPLPEPENPGQGIRIPEEVVYES